MAVDVRKTVTVVFADVTGSTALGERLDPEAVRRVMGRYFDVARAALEYHGGTVEKFIGDAVMAVFGIPRVHEDDALRAVRAAVEMRDRVGELNADLARDYGVTLQIRTGVNTGEVVTGEGQTLVTGDAVNVAARLEQTARPGEILIGEATRRLVGEAVELEAVDPLALKGKAEPVAAWRVLRVIDGAAPFARRLDAPMVGRQAEFAQLHRAFERAAAERTCRLATVLGAPGIGKSRLALELASAVEGEARVLAGHCLPYGEGITYWPVREIVRQAAGGETEGAIRALVADEDDADDIAALVASAIGGGLRAASATETFWAVRRLLEGLARDRPLVVIVEDVHWAEQTLLDLLEYVVGWATDAPILVLALARPELLEQRPSWPAGAASLALEPLAEADASALVETLLGETQLSDVTRRRILEAAEGNPLFVEQLLAMVGDDPAADVVVPPTIHALLADRLERLADDERTVLERASVIGREFWLGAVVDLVGEHDAAAAARHLMALVRKEFVRPARSTFAREDAFAFRHVLIRDAAYARLSKEFRAALHERFAAWLERKPGDYDELVGYHLEQAFLHRRELGPLSDADRELASRAAGRLAGAARAAFGRGDAPAAVNLVSRAIDLLPSDSRQRFALILDLADAYYPLGKLDRALAAAEEALAGARTVGDRQTEWRAVIDLHLAARSFGPSPGDVRDAERALAFFDETGDDRGRARARMLLGEELSTQGRYDAAGKMLKQAYEHGVRSGDPRSISMAGWTASWLSLVGPAPLADVLAWLESIGHAPMGHAVWRPAELAKAKAMLGEFAEARRLIGDSLAHIQERGLERPKIFVFAASGLVELLAGEPAAAEAAIRSALEAAKAIGEATVRPGLSFELARALYAQRDYDGAEAALAGAGAFDAEGFWIRAQLVSLRAKLLARRGDLDAAAELAHEAVRLADETDALTYRGDARVDLAEVLSLRGEAEQAARALDEARSLYEQKGNVAAARRTEALLEQLAAEPLAERD